MTKWLALGLVVASFAVACGDGSAPATASPATDPPTATDAPVATDSPAAQGPAAPDFELALASGETFSLSGEEKPVYMVYWAEW